MKPLLITLALFCLLPLAVSLGKDAKPTLYIPEGQLLSQPVTVYVANTNLTDEMEPTLQLTGVHTITQANSNEPITNSAIVVAQGQNWTEAVAGKSVPREGTMLVFQLDPSDFPLYKAAVRLTPALSWNNGTTNQSSGATTLYGHSVYLGRMGPGIIYTCIVVVIIVCIIWFSARTSERKSIIYLICGDDGYLSLWRTQLVAWTLAVGGLVFCYGLIRLEVPHIPETLVALMGLSVATGGLSSMAATSQWQARLRNGSEPERKKTAPQLSDLISSYSPTFKEVELSVPKAQMVFWTGIILVLFIAKSLLIGELWEVPWELVALTGVSQLGYVGDKATKRDPRPEPATRRATKATVKNAMVNEASDKAVVLIEVQAQEASGQVTAVKEPHTLKNSPEAPSSIPKP